MANEQNWDKDESMKQERPNSKNEGNFKNDPERASREGRKGGESKGNRS